MNFDELPPTLRAVYPRRVVQSIRRASPTRIIVRVTYDNSSDRWDLINGGWTFYNPSPKTKANPPRSRGEMTHVENDFNR